jgi:hypothetical protein
LKWRDQAWLNRSILLLLGFGLLIASIAAFRHLRDDDLLWDADHKLAEMQAELPAWDCASVDVISIDKYRQAGMVNLSMDANCLASLRSNLEVRKDIHFSRPYSSRRRSRSCWSRTADRHSDTVGDFEICIEGDAVNYWRHRD